jgi:hypothetical protein
MRRTLTLSRAALPLAAAAVLLTACSGDGDDDSAASSSSPETSASVPEATETETETEAPEAGSEFCTQAENLPNELEDAFSAQTDPSQAGAAFQEAADAVRAIEPPAEISDDWASLSEGLERYAELFENLDLTDPSAAATLQAEGEELATQLQEAGANVETYLAEECGIDTGAGEEPAAPTS